MRLDEVAYIPTQYVHRLKTLNLPAHSFALWGGLPLICHELFWLEISATNDGDWRCHSVALSESELLAAH